MRNSGKCPKCSGTNVLTNKNYNVYSKGRHEISGGSGMSMLRIDAYACIDCGFLEEYLSKKTLEHEHKMEKMKKRWEPIN